MGRWCGAARNTDKPKQSSSPWFSSFSYRTTFFLFFKYQGAASRAALLRAGLARSLADSFGVFLVAISPKILEHSLVIASVIHLTISQVGNRSQEERRSLAYRLTCLGGWVEPIIQCILPGTCRDDCKRRTPHTCVSGKDTHRGEGYTGEAEEVGGWH